MLQRLIFAALCAVLATPLVTASAALFPVQTGKAFAARALIEIAAFLYLWLALREPRYRPRGGALVWAILAYCAVVIVATVAGVNPYRSFFGNLERMNGALGLLHAALLFVVARGVLRTRVEWLRLFEVALAVSAVVAVLAIIEGVRIAGTPAPRPSSTLGHPDFLATYALFQAFFAVFVLLQEPVRWLRWGAGIALALNLGALAFAASRGAWVGIYAAAVCGAAALALVPRRRTAGVAALVVLLALPFAIRGLHGTAVEARMPHVVQRLAGSSLDDPSIRTRLRSVPMSLAAVAERPVLGFGPEHFRVAFDRHYVPEASLEQWFDHAHNKLADVAVETGVLGTLAYLAIFVVAGTSLLRYVRRAQAPSDRLAGAAALLLGIAYFVQNLFLFDTPVSQLLFFLLLAFVAHLTAAGDAAPPLASHSRLPGRARLAVALAAAVMLLAVIGLNALPWRAAVLGRLALAAQAPAEALAAYRHAMANAGFAKAEITRAFEDEFINRGRARSPAWTPVFDELRTQVEAVLADEPNDVRAFMRAANLYNEHSEIDARRLADAERVSRAGIALSPSRPDAYYELGVTHLKARDYGRAREAFGRVAALDGSLAWAQWGSALALLGASARTEGEAALDRALALGADWDTQPEVYVLTHAFVRTQPASGVVPLYERVVAARPKVARYRVMLATALADAGDPRRARVQAQAAVALDPSYAADARRFIEALPAE